AVVDAGIAVVVGYVRALGAGLCRADGRAAVVNEGVVGAVVIGRACAQGGARLGHVSVAVVVVVVVAGVGNAVAVNVGVADVADAVAVKVGLVRVGDVGAVVVDPAHHDPHDIADAILSRGAVRRLRVVLG